ncbi:hypothetical protein V8D89_000955 [Ganoderma adspersum]
MPPPAKARFPRKAALAGLTDSTIDFSPLSPMSFVGGDSDNLSLLTARGSFAGTSTLSAPMEPQSAPADVETWRLRPLPPIPPLPPALKPEKRKSPMAMMSPLSAPAIARRVSPFLTRARGSTPEFWVARSASNDEFQSQGGQPASGIRRWKRMASEARLNVDVLEIVSEFITEVSDVLSFALTSSLIHQIAIRRLLSMSPILFSQVKFHSFLFADAPARTPYVRALDIESGPCRGSLIPDLPPDSTSLLIEILTSCASLRSVTIVLNDDDPNGLICDLEIARTIAALSNLRALTLFCSNMCGSVLLNELCAPLRALSLWGYTREINFYHPATLETVLPRLARNLEKLEIGGFVYFIVRSLFLLLHGAPLLDHLRHLFPALDGTLCFKSPQFPDNNPLETHTAIRAANQRAQERSRSRPRRQLHRVACQPLMLYLLALRCPIKHVLLDAMDVPLDTYAVDARRDNPMPHLKLTIRHESPAFDYLFTPELAGKLTHLTLVFVYHFNTLYENPAETPGPPLWQDVLDRVVSSIQPLQRLTHLRVVIGGDADRRSVHWHRDDVKPIVACAKAYVGSLRKAEFDFDGTAAALVRRLPALEYLFVETDGYLPCEERMYFQCWHAVRGWRVEQCGTGEHEPMLVWLHEDIAGTIIGQEELAISADDDETFSGESLRR